MRMNKIEKANMVIDKISQKEKSAILFCSLGKDSLVLLDLLVKKYDRVVCVFMYFVPGLDHLEKWIQWVKSRYLHIEFTQVPHWNLSYVLRSGMYCIPNSKVKLLKLADVIESIRLKYGIYHVYLGMKKADGMNRRLMLNTYQDYENKGLVYPLAEWNQKDILAYMKQNRLPSPVRYGNNASNGIGFNIDCFLWLRENYPQDLQKVLKAFPMSERILYEYDLTK